MTDTIGWKEKALELDKQGDLSWRGIARVLGIPRTTVSDFLRRVSGNTSAEEQTKVTGAKVLFLDLEVSASVVAAFSMFKHYSSPDHIIQFPYVLTYAANWLHKPMDEIESYGLSDFELFKEDHRNDKALIEKLWILFDEADIVVIQNEGFDRGWATQRFAYHGLPEPSPYRVLCTLKGLKKAMSLPSNSLGYSTKYFNLGHNKLQHEGISLWIRCMDGDIGAFEKMLEYNRGDIPTLRELYLKVRAYIPNHPNVALYFADDVPRCGVCGSDSLEKLDKLAYTNLSSFEAYRCTCCGTVRRGGLSVTTAEQRKLFNRTIIK